MLSDPRSFEEILRFPPERDGFVSFGGHRGRQHPMHRHAELEMNLVTGGTAQYLLGDRRYDLCAGSLVWLFPRQDHVLLDRSPDYAHWVVVWRPEAVERACRSRPGHTLREPDPPGRFCRRLRTTTSAVCTR
jgi:quercetin dioxygenase-like cupin family protein